MDQVLPCVWVTFQRRLHIPSLRFSFFLLAALAEAGHAADFVNPTNLAASSSLLQGPGIAAKYPADQDIKTHPAVVFAEDFESAPLGASWDEVGNKNGNVLQRVPSMSNPALGNHCLQVEAHLGRDTGGGLTKWFESSPTIHVRFYTRFHPDCDYVHHFVTLRANRGLKGKDRWSGFGGAGLRPAGTDRYITDRWTKNPTNTVFFDNIVIARGYIGPSAKP